MMKGLLSDDQRARLQRIFESTNDAKACRRCGALLRLHDGKSVAEVAREFGVSRQTLYNWRKRMQDKSAPLTDRPRGGRPTKWTVETVAHLENALSRSPRDFGFQMVGWTTGLLKTLLIQDQGLEISEQTIRNKLHELGYVWKRFRYTLRPDPACVKKTAHPQCCQ